MIQDIYPKHLDNQYYNINPQSEDTVFFFEGSSVLGRQAGECVEYPTYDMFVRNAEVKVGKSADEQYDFIYLLSVDLEKYFLAMPKGEIQRGAFQGEMADSDVHGEYAPLIDGYEFIGVNMFRKAMPKYRAFAAITAYHLYGWYRDNRFCGRCGGRFEHSTKERMLHCPACKNMLYPKISPAVIVGVTNGSKLLLTKYANRTYKNYALVAGFTEIGETLEETVRREVLEEVGLKVKNIRYYKSQPWALSGSLLAGFYCDLDGDDTISIEETELSVGTWVEAEELESEDDGVSLTREMIVNFRKSIVGD